MKISTIAPAVALAALAACGEPQRSAPEGNVQGGAEDSQAQTYSATGQVTAVAGDQVTIAHGPVEALGWPAMTMSFTAPPEMVERTAVGRDVSFAFREDGGTYALTSLETR